MEWFLFISLISLLIMTIGYSIGYGITPTPTSAIVEQEVIRLLPHVGGEIVALGSGWGNLAFAIAKHYPNCKVIGYEISPLPFVVSKIVSYFAKLSNLTIKRVDFFRISLDKTSLVVCYLYPGAMVKLKVKFEKELPKSAYVISHTFAIPGWIPTYVAYAQDLYHTPIYLYKLSEVHKNKHENKV